MAYDCTNDDQNQPQGDMQPQTVAVGSNKLMFLTQSGQKKSPARSQDLAGRGGTCREGFFTQ